MNDEIKRLQAELAEAQYRVKELESAIENAAFCHIWATINSITLDATKQYIARRIDSYGFYTTKSMAGGTDTVRDRLATYLINDWEDFDLFGLDVELKDNKIEVGRYTYEIVEATK